MRTAALARAWHFTHQLHVIITPDTTIFDWPRRSTVWKYRQELDAFSVIWSATWTQLSVLANVPCWPDWKRHDASRKHDCAAKDCLVLGQPSRLKTASRVQYPEATHASQEEIDKIFNPAYYTRRVDDIFQAPVLDQNEGVGTKSQLQLSLDCQS